jgi:hypothetical protein
VTNDSLTVPPIPPTVRLGPAGQRSIAASIAALFERAALLRPVQARALRSTILLRFAEDFDSVRIDLRGEEIYVVDALADGTTDDRAYDLLVEGSLPDIVALIAAPLAGGLPKPTSAAGRAAIGRLADGRVEFDGRLTVARALLQLLTVAPTPTPRRGRRRREPVQASSRETAG